MRFHLLSLVHLPQSAEYSCCAYTQKNRKLAKMLTSLGHTVFFYGSEGSDVAEYCENEPGELVMVETHSLADIRADYGDEESILPLGYDLALHGIRHDFNDHPHKPSTLKFYRNCIEAINAWKCPDDFLLCTMGAYHSPIADEVKLYLTCEPGIGYNGTIRGRFRAFESSYLRNFIYGSEAPFSVTVGKYYDRVIPNYFDPNDVEFCGEKDDFYFFIGRIMFNKGVTVANDVCKHLGKKLVIAGAGATVGADGHLRSVEFGDVDLAPGTWEYVGLLNFEQRKKYMSKATAVFAPSLYLEPFGSTHVEAMLHGTPAITTDFGVFPETIPDLVNGKVGFRCNTFEDFVEAAKDARDCDPYEIRRYASRFLMGNVRHDFEQWFQDLHRVYLSTLGAGAKGWYHLGGGE